MEIVADAARWGDEEIALWFAREAPLKAPKTRYRHRRRPADRRRLVCLWAWFSGRTQDRARAYIETPWLAAMQWKAALDAANAWRDAMTLDLSLGVRGVEDAWLEDGEVDGYRFVALKSAAAIAEEAAAMKHCIATYGSRVSCNECRLWSVRREGARVATMALECGYNDSPLPMIVEISGEQNAPAPMEVWLAARRWLHEQDAKSISSERFKYRFSQFDAATWREMWRPYWLAKRSFPAWLPLAPSEGALWAL
jgi:hypothetical protein